MKTDTCLSVEKLLRTVSLPFMRCLRKSFMYFGAQSFWMFKIICWLTFGVFIFSNPMPRQSPFKIQIYNAMAEIPFFTKFHTVPMINNFYSIHSIKYTGLIAIICHKQRKQHHIILKNLGHQQSCRRWSTSQRISLAIWPHVS